MTKEQLAEMLNGRPMGDELSRTEQGHVRADGLVVIYGYSDDVVEIAGMIRDEVSAYDGVYFLLTQKGVEHTNREGSNIQALWCDEKPYSWTYKTKIPHAPFDILEDGEKFCRGMVINFKDLPA